jgi:serine/threonine-protein kinase
MRHMNEEPRPPRALAPTLSPATESAILTAMAKDPARRWPSATQFVQALAGDMGHATQTISLPGLPAAAATAPLRFAAERRGRRWLTVLLVSMGIGVALIAGVRRYADGLAPERAASLAAGSPDVLINSTRRALDAGAYPDALGMADLAQRLYPEHPGVRELRARVQRAWDAEKALQLWPQPATSPPTR